MAINVSKRLDDKLSIHTQGEFRESQSDETAELDISDEEYTKRKFFEQYHIEQRGYQGQPSVNLVMAASGTATVAGFVITQGIS